LDDLAKSASVDNNRLFHIAVANGEYDNFVNNLIGNQSIEVEANKDVMDHNVLYNSSWGFDSS